MSTQAEKMVHSQKQFTPLVALQIFSAAFIFIVSVMSMSIVFLKMTYGWEPAVDAIPYSPWYSVVGAGVCLALSFLIPEYLMDSVRRDLKQESPKEQTEDLPFILVPTVFIRFSLLSVVTIIGFIMSMSGRGITVFFPFVIISLALMVSNFPTETRMKTWLHAR